MLYWDNGKENGNYYNGLYWGYIVIMERFRNGIYYLGFRVKCRPRMNEPLPFKGLNIRIPCKIPIKGRGCY